MGLRLAEGDKGVRERGAAGRQPPPSSWGMGRALRPGPLSSLRIALYRLGRGWKLLLGVGAGILIAVILICTVPLYDALVAGIQLQRALATSLPQDRNLQVQLDHDHIAPSVRDGAGPTVAGLGRRYLAGFTDPTVSYYVTSSSAAILQAGGRSFDPRSAVSPQATFRAFDYAAAAPHMHVLAGSLPQDVTGAPQAIVTQEMAQVLGLHVGDTLLTAEFGDHSRQISLTIAGIWQPVDSTDPYWNGLSFSLSSGQDTILYPVLVTYDTFFGQISRFDNLSMAENWVYYTRVQSLDSATMAAASDDVTQFRPHLSSALSTTPGVTGMTISTQLDHIIADINGQQALLALPLYVIVAQVLGLTLIFVAGMGALLVESQSSEVATLRSRGASGLQVVGAFTQQAAVVALFALVVGPFAAAALAVALVRWLVPGGAAVNASYLTHIANPAAVVVPALIGALLGIGAVAFSAWQSARRDVLADRREQGRGQRAPFWRRYYLDVALAVLCFVGYLELGQFGSVQTRSQLSGGGASPLLLVTPGLLLLAGSLLVLRVFPYGAALCARIAARGRRATPVLAMAQVERNPGRYSRMLLLLALSVGLGLFALSFDSSLAANSHDRAAYTLGADVRVTATSGIGGGHADAIAHKMAALPGVAAVSQVYRTSARTPSDEGGNQVDLLGIEPGTFGQVAGATSWRDDYASQSLPALLADMKAHESGSAAAAAGGHIWTLVSDAFAAQHQLKVGDQFVLYPEDASFSTVSFVVGAIVDGFPTMYPLHAEGGYVVADSPDLQATIRADAGGDLSATVGPNEFWLRTDGSTAHQTALLGALDTGKYDLQISRVDTLTDALHAAATNPVTAGIRGLLLIGAIIAALLAVVGTVAQTLMSAHQRTTQFAVLRTLGLARRHLGSLLLGEQLVVYVFSLIGGTALGLVLSSAVLPFLQFSSTTVDPATLGVPPYRLTLNIGGSAIFYGALVVAFAVALLLASRAASRVGVGRALRIGED